MLNVPAHMQLKHRRRNQHPAGADCAPGTRLSFDPQLIPALRRDHVQQMQFVAVIRASARERRFDLVDSTLRQFHRHLQEHIVKEDLRIYAYLAYCLKDDNQKMPFMTAMRSEMSVIGRQLMRFLRRYDESGLDCEHTLRFIEEFEGLFKLLVKRNEYEESVLFPLYLHPSEVITRGMAAAVI